MTTIIWFSVVVLSFEATIFGNGSALALGLLLATIGMILEIYWRTVSPWIIVPVAFVVAPFITAYMWIRHPRQCWRLWRDSRGLY
jgi:UDP-N-acetylmuramyl pentapeptide phosphotransferase/UDP-N-acetylglucosamine-1-phosphate transferase